MTEQEYINTKALGTITAAINTLKDLCAENLKDTIKEGESKKQPFLNLNKRQLKILKYLQKISQIKREEYVEIMEVSTMTAYRDLDELVKKGLLKVSGQGRSTRYILASK